MLIGFDTKWMCLCGTGHETENELPDPKNRLSEHANTG